jgi:hypothetical protein
MYTKKITDSDAFIELSSAAQALYFHLNQAADDDGFNNQIQNAMFKAHASVDDLKILMAKNFIIRFESGVIVIKHWRMHNTLRQDRYHTTNYQKEFALLGIKDNGAYTLKESGANWLPSGCQTVTTGKVSKEKGSIVEDNYIEAPHPTRFTPPTIDEVVAYGESIGGRVDAQRFVDFYESKGWMVGKSKMKDWKAAYRNWNRKEPPKTESSFDIDEFFDAAINTSYGG